MGKRGSFALIVAGSPVPSSIELVSQLAAQAKVVIAVDRGAIWCQRSGAVPTLLVGDEDTVSQSALAWAREHGVCELAFDPMKDDTDLSLAFRAIREQRLAAPGEVVVTCAIGGRPDHALGVFGVLSKNADLAPRLVEDGLECRVLSPLGIPTWKFGAKAVGHTFSAVALAPTNAITERGMRWEVDHLPLRPLQDRALSNVIERPGASIACDEGVIAAFLID
ncbi:MAG: thiamine diphosphokinase [Tractidigestivibacter sp.]|jgi:thiamine pyrophosphokinase|uniref:thiamine diphosphokinase n=1 Tax=Tractidigestivibacter sp. TaxID=2847320 RepID=UPI003D8F028B